MTGDTSIDSASSITNYKRLTGATIDQGSAFFVLMSLLSYTNKVFSQLITKDGI